MNKLILFGIAVLTFLAFASSAKADTWNGWTNNFTVGTRTAVNATAADYVIRVNVTWQTGMNTTFNDLFPTTMNKATNLSFSIFNYTASQYAIMEVNIPVNITTDFYNFTVWYGNLTYNNRQVYAPGFGGNKLTTYIFSDDFNRADADSIGTNYTEGNGNVYLVGNALKFNVTTASADNTVIITGLGSSWTNVSMRMRVNESLNGDHGIGPVVRTDTNTDGTHYGYAALQKNLTYMGLISLDEVWGSQKPKATANATYKWIEVAVSGQNVYGKIWNESEPEPNQWTLNSTTFTKMASGYFGIEGFYYINKGIGFVSNITTRRFWDWEPQVNVTYPTIPGTLPQPTWVTPSSNATAVSIKSQIVNVTDLNTVSSGKIEWCNTTCVNYTATCTGKYCYLNMSQTANLTYVVARGYLTNASGENVTKDMYINFSNLQTPPDPCMNITVSGSGQETSIKLNGSITATLDDIWACVSNTTTLLKYGNGVWMLNANLSIEKPATLNIIDVYWLKLNSSVTASAGIIHNISGNRLIIDNSTVTTWNVNTNSYDLGSWNDPVYACGGSDTADARSFINIVNSTGTSWITDSNVSYFGYGCGWSPENHLGVSFDNATFMITNSSFTGSKAISIIMTGSSIVKDSRFNYGITVGLSVSSRCYSAAGCNVDQTGATYPGSWNITVENNTCWGNTNEHCIYSWNSTNSIFKDNIVRDGIGENYGMGAELGDNISFINNSVWNTKYGIDISYGAKNIFLFKNNFSYNTYSIYSVGTGWGTMTNNTFHNNTFLSSNIWINTAETSGWNLTFNSILSTTVSNSGGALNATWNDWGVYDNASIAAKLSGSVTYYPFLGMSGADTTPPSILWGNPSNGTFTANQSWIWWNASLNETPNVCLLSINNSANISMTSSGSNCYYNSTSLTNQTTYCGLIWANDSTGNMGVSTVQCATINLTQTPATPTIPNPYFIAPANGTNVTTNHLFVNVSDYSAVTSCILQWSPTTNYTMSPSGKYCTYNVTGLTANTTQIYRVFVTNSSGTNVTYDWSTGFTIQTLAPVVTITSPTNSTYSTLSIPLNATSTSNGSMWYSLNEISNVSMNNCYQRKADSSDSCGLATGTYNITTFSPAYWVVGSEADLHDGYYETGAACASGSCDIRINWPKNPPANSAIMTVVWLGITNVTIPSDCYSNNPDNISIYVTFRNPSPGMNVSCYNGTWVSLVWNPNPSNLYYYEIGMNWISSTNINTTITASEGSNLVTVWANDSLGNIGSDSEYFTIDSIAPSLSFVSPTLDNNSAVYNIDWIFVNVSSSEALDTCIVDWNGVNQTMTVGGSYCYKNMTLENTTTAYYFRVYGNDSVGHLGVTENREITGVISVWNVSLYTENDWDTPASLPGANLSLIIKCIGGSQVIYNMTGNNITGVVPFCDVMSLGIKADYGSDSYIREVAAPDCDGCEVRIYMIDALIHPVLQIPIYIDDFDYYDSNIEIYKTSGANHYTITQGDFDVEHKYVTYLAKDNTYYIRITKGSEVRDIGFLYATAAAEQHLAISQISLNPSIRLISDNILMSAAFDNASAPTSTLRVQYHDLINMTESVRIRIFNTTSGTPWYDNTILNSDSFTISLNNINTSVRHTVHFTVEHSVLGNSPIDFDTTVGAFGINVDLGLPLWVYPVLAFCIMLISSFVIVPENRLMGYFMLMLELGIFGYFSWLTMPATGLAMPAATIALLLIFLGFGIVYELKYRGTT